MKKRKARKIIQEAILSAGGDPTVARAVGKSTPAVRKWRIANKLPRTEITGETDYSTVIAKLTNKRFTRNQLIQATQDAWRKR